MVLPILLADTALEQKIELRYIVGANIYPLATDRPGLVSPQATLLRLLGEGLGRRRSHQYYCALCISHKRACCPGTEYRHVNRLFICDSMRIAPLLCASGKVDSLRWVLYKPLSPRARI